MALVISVKNLVKTYVVGEVEVRALRGVNLDVEVGEFLAVTGPSGSGKSTFMHIAGCLDKPTSGPYLLDGQDVSRMSKDALASVRNKKIGFVFQGFNLLSRTSALDNVMLPLLYRGGMKSAERQARAMEVLTAVNLAGLTRIELTFGLCLAVAAGAIVLALRFAERRRTFAIAKALGATHKQLRSFVVAEAYVLATCGLVGGAAVGGLLLEVVA